MARVQGLAQSVQAEPTLERIVALCCQSSDSRFPFAVISFICSREIIAILSDWVDDNIHCSGLLRLAQAVWIDSDLAAQIRPFGADQRVDKMFRNETEEQYLASMAACRRAIPNDAVATWLQVLRLYILVRALDALESSVIREAHLFEVCRTLRNVCETTQHKRHAWIKKIAGSSVGFFEFESETLMNCRAALPEAEDAAGRSFFKALISILEHKPWSKLPVKSGGNGNSSVDPYTQLYPHLARFFPTPFTQHSDFDEDEVSERPSGKKVAQSTGLTESHSKRRFNGEKIRLETLENYLFLPHSWHHISRNEETVVFARLTELLRDESKVDRFGAAVAFLALQTGQSINDASKMRFGLESANDWRLNVAAKLIHKLAPRFSKRWHAPAASPEKDQWLTPLSGVWEYKLATDITKPISNALRITPTAADLDDLWQSLNPGSTLVNWFGSVFTASDCLHRLSGPSTASHLSLRVFENSQDHATARLLASDHRTALPAACAYGSYRGSEVASLMRGSNATEYAQMVLAPIDADHNAAGSELDINLPLLRRTIAQLTKRVNTAAEAESWCEHHNLLTALCVLALLASTGARPVNSPFQSAAWIDLERGLIYIQDKAAGPTQGSRICVLSKYAIDLLQNIYFPHMKRLAGALKTKAPEFSSEIGRVLGSDPEARLPLFFFLRCEPTLDWLEVSESQLDFVCHFNWPLPWNLFRHFSSTHLRRMGLHADIRDALLGHAERDAESHGDFSSRIPFQDFEIARPLINKLQDDLGFTLPNDVSYTHHIGSALKTEKELLQSAKPFGRQAREIRRKQHHAAVQAIAKSEIFALLGSRSIDQLTPDELDQIGRQMLMRATALPHVMGSLRYETFENFLSSEWRTKGRHAKLKRRYILIEEGRSCFTEQVLTAHQNLNVCAANFESLVQTRTLAHERPVFAAALATIDLILYSRLAHFPMICALLCNTEAIELVRFQSRHWLEWGHGAPWQDGKPVIRIEVTDRAAHWISLATKGKTSSQVPSLPSALVALCASLNPKHHTLAEFIRQLVALQSQKNSLELAGFMAAYLAGRKQSSALPHADWIRIVKHAAPKFSSVASRSTNVDPTDGDLVVEHFFRNHHASASRSDEPALERCQTLFDQVRAMLNSDQGNSKIAAQIARDVKTSGFAQGDAPFMLCHFIAHVLKRKPKRGSREHLRSNTALRYWYSLATPFLSVAAGENWTDVEEDELTVWYEQIVAAMTPDSDQLDVNAKSDTPNMDDSQDDDGSDRSKATDAPLRTLMQLREFHDFARSTYGLPDPDWSEISSDLLAGVGRPGLVLIEEYLTVLSRQLGGRPASKLDDLSLSKAFVLFLCARFGLRLGEAVGLLRSDWLDIGKTITVLVVSNSIRSLKTSHSKRKVPLIEVLTEHELEVIQTILDRWMHHEGINQRSPLIAGVSTENFKERKSVIGSQLLIEIKRVTQHEASTLHALRHAFGMRVLAMLQARPLGSGTPANQNDVKHARQLLICSAQLDRRVFWAVARLLGHGGPGITMRSYINCIDLWLPSVADKPLPTGLLRPINLIDLDRIEVDAEYLTQSISQPDKTREPLESSMVRALRFLRLLAIGQTEISAQKTAQLLPIEVALLTLNLRAASAKLAPAKNRFESYQILSAIPVTRFMNLVDLVERAKIANEIPRPMPDWLDTIGPSRQIILFEEHHFNYMAQFLESFQLTFDDVHLISKKTLHPEIELLVKTWKLKKYIHPKDTVSATFQLDVARFGTTNRIAPERVVAIASRQSILQSSYELLLLWILWEFWSSSVSTEKPSE